jgi:hypothetical protein
LLIRNDLANARFEAPELWTIIASRESRRVLTLLVITLITACACHAQTQSVKHSITVTFDYDFTVNRACSTTVTTKCIARFNVYDISGGKPYKLFSIPTPADASGRVKGITGDSQPLLFESGKHLFAVTAQMASGEESNPHACEVWAEVS